MITRRRGRMLNSTVEEEQPVEVEVCASDLSPGEAFPAEDLDVAAMELDDLFGIDDFKWTLDRDPTSPLFDMELSQLGVYGGEEQDPSCGVSSASSPERRDGDFKTRHRQSGAGHGLNKNAIAARLNRIKKKEYVNTLEKKVTGLSSENGSLKRENAQLAKRVEELEDETRAPRRTRTTTTTRCHASGSKWRRRARRRAECAFTSTETTCLWSSAPNVQRVRALRLKCRVKYLPYLLSHIRLNL